MGFFSKLLSKFRRKPRPVPPPPTATFTENFQTLDNWIVSSWTAPMGGTFRPENVSVQNGILRLVLTQIQNPDGSWSSIGGEVATKQKFGYGTYAWEARASSTAMAPFDVGGVVPGGITGMFNYAPNSETEIDIEIESNVRSNLVQFTHWQTEVHKEATNVNLFPNPAEQFNRYKFVWTPTYIDFYVNDVYQSRHTQYLPSLPAAMMFNHWGTNNENWGGPASVGARFMYVRNFSFTGA